MVQQLVLFYPDPIVPGLGHKIVSIYEHSVRELLS